MNTKSVSFRIFNWILILTIVASINILPASSTNRGNNMASYIVQGSDLGQVTQLVEAYGGEVTSELAIINGVGANLPLTAISQLQANPVILAITPNGDVDAAGKAIPGTDYGDVVGADVVWADQVDGEGVTVAVVDTGINHSHNGLKRDNEGNNGRIVAWADFIENKNNPEDDSGHGSHVAGIIANSEIGEDGEWNGVAPGVNLAAVRVLDQYGRGTYESVIQGIQWVIDHKDEYNIRVMNLSLVAPVHSPYWADPLNQAAMRAWAEGIVVVVAAGNGGPEPMTIGVPGNNPYVITVGAFTDNYTPYDWNDDYITPFSAAGPTLDGFAKPDVVAPGAHMVSLMKPSDQLVRDYPSAKVANQYYSIAGTSQAAAVTSGVAALAIAHNPNLTPDEVKYRLMYTAAVWVDPQTSEALYSIWQQGFGRINAPGTVFADINGIANTGLDIQADLAGDQHYEGYSYYDDSTGAFKMRGEFGTWAGGFGTWAGGFGTWAGGFGTWAGEFGTWAGGFGTWAGGFGTWAGGFGTWAGGFGTWAGGFGTWAGGFGTWAGGFGTWAGSEPWAGTLYADPDFVSSYLAGESPDAATTTTSIGISPQQ